MSPTPEPDFAQMAAEIYDRQGNVTDVAREAYEAGVEAAASVPPPAGAVVVEGSLGWGNPGIGEMNHQLDAYGPLGRWHNEGRTRGQRLPDALVEAGATEGARLIVVAVNRFEGDYESIRAAVTNALTITSKEPTE